jgi:predicted porin
VGRMKKLLVAVLVLAAPVGAQAQPEFAYYGVSLGSMDYSEELFDTELFGDTVGAWYLMVGYQFMEHLTVEGGYGQSKTIKATNSEFFEPPLQFRGDFRILSIRLLGVLPFDNGLSLLGGIAYSDMKQDFEITDGIDRLSSDRSSNEPGLYLAAQYNWDRFAVRIAFDKRDFGDSPFGEIAEIRERSLSFFYKL